MKNYSVKRNSLLAAALVVTFSIGGIMPAFGQDLVPVSNIGGGGSSVFVLRPSKAPKKFSGGTRTTRSKAQKAETAKKIKKQVDTLAKAEPRRVKSTVVTPDKVPTNMKTISKEQASKLFAGVGEYYIDRDDAENSINFFRESTTLDANNIKAREGLSEAFVVKANKLQASDQGTSAKAYFLEALKYDPKNAAAYVGLGSAYTDLDQVADAIVNYEKALAANPNLTEIYLPLGVLYYQKGEIAKADEMLTRAVADSAESAETLLLIGQIRGSQNRNDEALVALNRAKALDPNNAEAFYYTGDVLMRLGRLNDAIIEFQRASSLKPNYFEALRGAGQANFELKNYKDSVAAYQAATRAKNDNADTYAALGEANRMAGNYNDAESAYATAKDLMARMPDYNKDDQADIYSKIGFVIGQQCELNMRQAIACRWPAAIAAFQKAVDITGSPIDRANLGWAYYNQARVDINSRRPDAARPTLELAKSTLQMALTGNPKITDGVLQNLGGVQIDQGDFRGAIESLKPVVNHQPDWVFAKYALGTAYFKVDEFENAEPMFRAAADMDPTNVGYLASLGYTLIKLKRGGEVKKIVARLKKLDAGEALKLEQTAKFANVK